MGCMHQSEHKKQQYYFIGIGGIGISALAKFLVSQGHTVSGINDSVSPETLDELRAQGVSIDIYEHRPDNTFVIPKADVYVYSVAWENRAPEVVRAAKDAGKKVYTYFEALGIVLKPYNTIAIAGTHGKTTTTAMVAQALIAAGLDPTVIVGSVVDWDGVRSNFRAGTGDYVVVEACEYKRHFLHLHPHVLGITNIELDHPDYYKDDADVHDAFAHLQKQSKTVVTQTDAAQFLSQVPHLLVPGEHNRANAALALAVCNVVGADVAVCAKSLERFKGTWRRFEYKGKTATGALVYDDYAHHPTAIRATLKAAKEQYPNKKIVAVFEPHMFSRTQRLIEDFAQAFGDADEAIIAPIYPAREAPIEGIDQYVLVDLIEKHLVSVRAADSLEDAVTKARELADKDSVILFMSAGDIYQHIPSIIV